MLRQPRRETGPQPIPELLHRALFKGVSLLPPGGQAVVLRRYFDWWHRSPDPWRLQTDAYEQRKYATTLQVLPDRPYRRILDVGCAEGAFTHLIAAEYPEAQVTGVDISERALNRARARPGPPLLSFTRADLIAYGQPGEFDLVVCAETLYYLGRDDRLRLASARLVELVRPGGLLLLVHPWPEADRLYTYLGDPMTRVLHHVDEDAHRPFSVTVFQSQPGPDAAAQP
ncbi:class I SAM-dependent methyltransferase [Nonomuraea antimicrobica]|uniref:class I SAM-dependent methyltransferase n=1 Tax=Nonomuraea antimicrobica TaxID=561173 RepID=UPI0031E6ED87